MARKPTVTKPVAAFDLDGTLFREALLTLLFHEFFRLGIFEKVAEAAFNEAYLEHRDRKVHYSQYERQLVELFLERIRGKLVTDVEAAGRLVAKRHKDLTYRFTASLLDAVAESHSRVAITGALEEIVRVLGPMFGFDHIYATILEKRRKCYTGKQLSCPPIDKRTVMLAHLERTSAPHEGSLAIGDTASDIPMLELVARPIAFNPSDTLAAEAEKRGWPIVLERKDSIYVMAGCVSRRFGSGAAKDAVDYVLALPPSDRWRCEH